MSLLLTACNEKKHASWREYELWTQIGFKSKLCESASCLVVSDFLWPRGIHSPWNSPGQNTGVGSLSLLQGIFPNQGLNQGLPHCRQVLYQLSHKGSPKIQEWVNYPFSSRSSWLRNWTRVSCIAGGFFTNWAMREAPKLCDPEQIIYPLFL